MTAMLGYITIEYHEPGQKGESGWLIPGDSWRKMPDDQKLSFLMDTQMPRCWSVAGWEAWREKFQYEKGRFKAQYIEKGDQS